MRRLGWIVVLLVALVVAAAVAAVVLVRPGLEDGRDQVDARWAPLRPALITRYQALSGVAGALHDAGAADRSVTKDLDGALRRWNRYALLGPKHTDPAAEVQLANELEQLARRLRANLFASPKLKGNEALATAVTAFDQATVAQPRARAYNRAVRSYEADRSGFPESLVAEALGYDSRSVLVVGTDA
jgi:hypothetical protein